MNKLLYISILCLFSTQKGISQGTVEDYQRAYALGSKFNSAKVYNSPSDLRWKSESPVFTYSKQTPEGRVFVAIDASTQEKKSFKTQEELQQFIGGRSEGGRRWGERKWFDKLQRQRHWMEVDDEKDGRPVLSPEIGRAHV